MPRQFKPKDFLLDPQFHGLDREVRRSLLLDVWPDFAKASKIDQEATLDTPMDKWESIINPPPPAPKSRLERASEWLGQFEPPPATAMGSPFGGLEAARQMPKLERAAADKLEPPPVAAAPAGGAVQPDILANIKPVPSHTPTPQVTKEDLQAYKESLDTGQFATKAAALARGITDMGTQLIKGLGLTKAQIQTGGMPIPDAETGTYKGIPLHPLNLTPEEKAAAEKSLTPEDIANRELLEGRKAEVKKHLPTREALGEAYFGSDLYKFGDSLEKSIHRMLPINPKYANDFTTGLAQGAGSMIAFMGLGMFGRAVGLPSLAVTTGTGALSQVAQPWEEAFAKGGKPEDLQRVFVANLGLGATEGLPVEHALDRLDKATGGWATRWIADYGRRVISGAAVKQGGEEFLQEFMQQFGQNLVAKGTYDNTQDIWDGVLPNSMSGLILGAAFGSLAAHIGLGKVRGQLEEYGFTKEQIAQIEKDAKKYDDNIDAAIAARVKAGLGPQVAEERGIAPYVPEAVEPQPEPGPVPEKYAPIAVDIRGRPKPKALPPAPGLYTAEGAPVGPQPELNLGEEGGLGPAPKPVVDRTRHGIGPEEGIQPEEIPEKELPFTKTDYDLMLERISLAQDGIVKLPTIQDALGKIKPEDLDERVKLALRRGDFAWLRDVRERLGVGPELLTPTMTQPQILEPEVTKEGLDRLRMFQERRLERPGERKALPPPPVENAAVQRGIERAQMGEEGLAGIPTKKRGLLPPPGYSYEETGAGALVEKRTRRKRIVPGQRAFPFKSETGAQRLALPPNDITEGLDENDFEGMSDRLRTVRNDFKVAENRLRETNAAESNAIDERREEELQNIGTKTANEWALAEVEFLPQIDQIKIDAYKKKTAAMMQFADEARVLYSPEQQRQMDRAWGAWKEAMDQRMKPKNPMEEAILEADKARGFYVSLKQQGAWRPGNQVFDETVTEEQASQLRDMLARMNAKLAVAEGEESDRLTPIEDQVYDRRREVDRINQEAVKAANRRFDHALVENKRQFDERLENLRRTAREQEQALMDRMMIAPPFYSRLEKAFVELNQDVFTPEQAEALASKFTSKDELEYIGLANLFNVKKIKKEKVTKKEILEAIEEGKLKTDLVEFTESQYAEYSEPGYNKPEANYGEFVVHRDVDSDKLNALSAKLHDKGAVQLSDGSILVLDPTGKLEARYQEILGMSWGRKRSNLRAFRNRIEKLIRGERTTLTGQMRLGFEGGTLRDDIKTLRVGYSGRVEAIYGSSGEAVADLLSSDNEALFADWHDGHPQYQGIPDPIVRVRYTTRHTNDGRRILFMEEIQAPHGDPEYYVTDPEGNRLRYDNAAKAKKAARDFTEQVQQKKGDEFNAKTDTIKIERKFGGEFGKMPKWAQNRWMDIGLKRALRFAAENGFDGLAWTTGQMQADRYNLARHVDKITYDPLTTNLYAEKDSEPFFDQNVPEDKLSSYVGPDIARKLMQQADTYRDTKRTEDLPSVTGDDLKMDQTGLIQIYDEMIPRAVNDLVKKFGQKVEPVTIAFPLDMSGWRVRQGELATANLQGNWIIYNRESEETLLDEQGLIRAFPDFRSADDYLENYLANQVQDVAIQSVPISRELRISAVRKGFALLQETGVERRPPKEALEAAKQGEKEGIVEEVGLPSAKPPVKTVKSYKLFRVDPKQPGRVFPLFITASDSIPLGEWVDAQIGPRTKEGKVKSKIGPLAMRPGWHSGSAPAMPHVGEVKKGRPKGSPPDFRPDNQVWAEVEMPDDVEWQTEANRNGTNAKGQIVPIMAAITDRTPKGGYYKFKTKESLKGDWYISGAIKVNRLLSDAEVAKINKSAGVRDLPRRKGAKLAQWVQDTLQSGPFRKGLEAPPSPRVNRIMELQAERRGLMPKIYDALTSEGVMSTDEWNPSAIMDIAQKISTAQPEYIKHYAGKGGPALQALVARAQAVADEHQKLVFEETPAEQKANPARSYGLPDIKLAKAEAERFVGARGQNKRVPFLGSQTAAELEAEGVRLYMSEAGQVGYGITPDGELVNLYNNGGPKGGGVTAAMDAIRRGAYWLNCFDNYLPNLYAKLGFEEVARVPFNDEYAPAGWNYESEGRPDIVFMAWKGTDYAQPEQSYTKEGRPVGRRGIVTDSYDQAKALARAAATPGWDVAAGAENRGGEESLPAYGAVLEGAGLGAPGAEGVRGVLTGEERMDNAIARAAEAEDVRASSETYGGAVPRESRTGVGQFLPGQGAGGRPGLEAPVQSRLEGPPELPGGGTERGGGGPEQGLAPPPVALKAEPKARVVPLAPGQTANGRKVANSIDNSPSVETAFGKKRVTDFSGDVDRALMRWVADHPTSRALMEHASLVFDRVREALAILGTENFEEYQRTVFDGLTLDPTCAGIFWPGKPLYGTGGSNLTYLNPAAIFDQLLKTINNSGSIPTGILTRADMAHYLSESMVNVIIHECIHAVERNESETGHRKVMHEFYQNNEALINELVGYTRDFLENDENGDHIKGMGEIHKDWVATVAPFYNPGSFYDYGVALFKRAEFVPTEEHFEKVRDMIVNDDITSKPKAIGKFREAFSGIRNTDFDAIWKRGVEYAAQLIDGLTPDEAKRVGKTAQSVKTIVDAMAAMPPDTDLQTLARMGEAKRGWYYRAVRACRALADMVDPSDRIPLVRILAATSPRQSVKENMIMALGVYQEWIRRGRPGAETPRAEFEEWVPQFAPMSSRWNNVINAMRGEPFSDASLKVSSFANNMVADVMASVEAVTNDTWMNRLLPEWLKLGNYTGYFAASAKVRKVAKQMGWQPREVQETIWSVMKTLFEIATSKGESRSLKQIYNELTEEDIIQHGTEFAVLLTQDKDIYDALVKLGIDPEDLRNKIDEYGGGYEPRKTGGLEKARTSLSRGLEDRLQWSLEEYKRKKREAAERRATARELNTYYASQGYEGEDLKERVLADMKERYPDAYKQGEKLVPPPEEAETLQVISEEERAAKHAEMEERKGIQGLEPPPGSEEFGPFRSVLWAPGEGPQRATLPPPLPVGATPDLDDARRVFEKNPPPPKPTIGERIKGFAHEVERRWITEFAPIAHLEARLRKQAGLRSKPYLENMATWMEATYGAPAKAERDLVDFEDVVEPIKDNLADFDTFLFLRRTQDRLQEDPQKRRVGKWDLPKVQRAFAQMRAEIGNQMVDEFYKVADHYVNNGVFVEGPYQKLMDRALQLMVHSGRMSIDAYNTVKGMNDFYAPFKVLQYLDPDTEVTPGGGIGRKIATRADLTHAIKGIDNPDFRIDSILAASAQQIYRARILAEKNLAMLEMSKLAQLDPNGDQIRFVKGPVFIGPSAPGEKGRWILPSGEGIPKDKEVLPFKKDGENVALIVDKDVGVAVQGLNAMQAKVMSTTLRYAMMPARWGATTFNLAFQPVNYLFADMPRLAAMSKYGIQNPVDAVRFFGDFMAGTISAFRGTFTNADYLYKKALEMGVLNSTIQKILTPEIFAEKYGLVPEKGGLLRRGKRLTIDNFAKFANALEESTKLAGLRRALRLEQFDQLSGRAKIEAANRIRTELRRYSGSPDFARSGTDARMMNVWVMFINARIQGTHSDMARLLGKTGRKDAAAVWARMGAMMLPMLAVALLNRGDDDLAKDYAQVPQWEKDNYFMIPLPSRFMNDDGVSVRNYARIPKREVFKLFGNMIDSVIGFMADKDPPSVASVADEFLGNISPINIQGKTAREKGEAIIGGMNPVIKAPSEWIFNRDMFRHRDVVPKSMEPLPPEMQYKRTTPQVYVTLGQMTGFSPLRIQQATSGISAGLLTQFTWGKPPGDRGWYSELPVVKRFIRSNLVSSEAEDARLQEAIAKNQTDSAIKKQLAEHIYETIKDKPHGEQMRMLAKVRRESKDPLLAETLKKVMRDAKRGLTYQDRQMLRLSVRSGDRAAYIMDALERLPNDQARDEWIKDLRKKKIITKDVMIQIRKGKRPLRRTSNGGLEPPP